MDFINYSSSHVDRDKGDQSLNALARVGQVEKREMAVSCLHAQIKGDLSNGFSFFDTQSLTALHEVRLIPSQLYNVVIQQHVQRLLQNPETREKLENNLLKVGKNLSLECCAKGWDKLLKFLMDNDFLCGNNFICGHEKQLLKNVIPYVSSNLLKISIEHEHYNVAELLIKNGANLVQMLRSSIGSDVFSKTLKCFKLLKFDVNMEIGQRGNEKLTLLNEAIDQEDMRAVNMLIRSGAEINPRQGIFSPLRQAAMQGLTSLVHQLIALGATDHVDIENMTALDHAIHDWYETGFLPQKYGKYYIYVRENYFQKIQSVGDFNSGHIGKKLNIYETHNNLKDIISELVQMRDPKIDHALELILNGKLVPPFTLEFESIILMLVHAGASVKSIHLRNLLSWLPKKEIEVEMQKRLVKLFLNKGVEFTESDYQWMSEWQVIWKIDNSKYNECQYERVSPKKYIQRLKKEITLEKIIKKFTL